MTTKLYFYRLEDIDIFKNWLPRPKVSMALTCQPRKVGAPVLVRGTADQSKKGGDSALCTGGRRCWSEQSQGQALYSMQMAQ